MSGTRVANSVLVSTLPCTKLEKNPDILLIRAKLSRRLIHTKKAARCEQEFNRNRNDFANMWQHGYSGLP